MIFWLLLDQAKSNSPRGHERAAVQRETKNDISTLIARQPVPRGHERAAVQRETKMLIADAAPEYPSNMQNPRLLVKTPTKAKISPKAGKGLTEKRAGCLACSAEAFFCLDLLVTFCIKTKSNSPRGN